MASFAMLPDAGTKKAPTQIGALIEKADGVAYLVAPVSSKVLR